MSEYKPRGRRNKIFTAIIYKRTRYIKSIDIAAAGGLLQGYALPYKDLKTAPGYSKVALTPFEVMLEVQSEKNADRRKKHHQSRQSK